jgi:cell division protein FtsW (lipid II flippase)
VTATETSPAPVVVPRKGRNVELALLVLSLVIGVGAYLAVELAVNAEIPEDALRYGLGLAAVLAAAHVAVRRLAPYGDPVLLPVVASLNGIGLAMIHRLDLAAAARAAAADSDPPVMQAQGQLFWTAGGVALFVLVLLLVRDHRLLARYTYTAGLAGLVLILLPLVPGLGQEINGARIWIQVGGLSFQPAEAAKIVFIVCFAGYLVTKRDALALAGRRVLGVDLPRGRDLGPILVVWAVCLALLVFQTDLGTSVLFFGVFVVLLYVATERPGWLLVGALLAVVGGFVAYQLFPHVQARVQGWLDPFSDPDQFGQIIQALYGLAYGGILGTGWGQGRPDLIPYAQSDFIAAALGEELGLTGLMAIIVMYALLVERGLRTALVLRDDFGKLLATGLAAVITLQVFVVIGGVTKLIPLTGLTTPFLSLGGSSLVMNWAIVALLMRMSDAARRPPPPTPPPVDEALTQAVAARPVDAS